MKAVKTTFRKNSLLLILLLLGSHFSYSQSGLSTRESDYYTPPTRFVQNKNLRTDYGVDNNFNTNDSRKLQNAIDFISENGGGKLIIPAGKYSFESIWLKSNVHIVVNRGAIIRPAARSNTRQRNYSIFHVTSEEGQRNPIRNVSITSSGGKFLIDLSLARGDGKRVRVFDIRNVHNLLLSNFKIKDFHTRFASLEFLPLELPGVERLFSARKVLVKNLEGIGSADYGYGLIQIRSGKQMMFRNLGGIGGTTLRLEGHLKVFERPGGRDNMEDIVGRGIRCKNGNAALMLSPHYINNGIVDIRNISSINCGFAARLENAFTTSRERELGLTNGRFHPRSVVSGIKATFHNSLAQLKTKHYNLIPCSLRRFIQPNAITPSPDGVPSFNGPSVAAVTDATNYTINFKRNSVTITGDVPGGSPRLKISRDEDPHCSRRLTVNINELDIENDDFVVSYNKLNKQVELLNNTDLIENKVYLTDLSGAVLYNNVMKSANEVIDVSGFTPGIYIVKIEGNKAKKVIIN